MLYFNNGREKTTRKRAGSEMRWRVEGAFPFACLLALLLLSFKLLPEEMDVASSNERKHRIAPHSTAQYSIAEHSIMAQPSQANEDRQNRGYVLLCWRPGA